MQRRSLTDGDLAELSAKTLQRSASDSGNSFGEASHSSRVHFLIDGKGQIPGVHYEVAPSGPGGKEEGGGEEEKGEAAETPKKRRISRKTLDNVMSIGTKVTSLVSTTVSEKVVTKNCVNIACT